MNAAARIQPPTEREAVLEFARALARAHVARDIAAARSGESDDAVHAARR
jgi:hypothetical protein